MGEEVLWDLGTVYETIFEDVYLSGDKTMTPGEYEKYIRAYVERHLTRAVLTTAFIALGATVVQEDVTTEMNDLLFGRVEQLSERMRKITEQSPSPQVSWWRGFLAAMRPLNFKRK